ncbi:MAG: phosphotransferase family protein [Gammaproteobacteria bacterium]|nr:phosphotransferase family protein [Gammaproteobacteria bacterium]
MTIAIGLTKKQSEPTRLYKQPNLVNASLDAIGTRLAAYLTDRWGETQTITDIEQIPGGASRETYRVKLRGADSEQGLILRRDPVSSLIDTERALEYQTYVAVFPTEIPVPEPLVLEEDPKYLDRPFSVMREITGCESDLANLALPPYVDVRERIAEIKWSLLGKLATLDIDGLGITGFMETPAHPAARELDYWAGVINEDSLHPEPVAQAAIRWLEKNLPEPSGNLVLVHGDYRTGNFLYTETGDIEGILDWEMAHIGDPLEDLAWSLDPLWSWPEQTLAGGLIPRADAIGIWAQTSGYRVDRRAFRWWQIFASLKGLAIWISSTENFTNGVTKEPILAVAGWLMTDRQNRILVDRLNPDSPHQYAEPVL